MAFAAMIALPCRPSGSTRTAVASAPERSWGESGRFRQGTGGLPGRRPPRAHVLMLPTLRITPHVSRCREGPRATVWARKGADHGIVGWASHGPSESAGAAEFAGREGTGQRR